MLSLVGHSLLENGLRTTKAEPSGAGASQSQAENAAPAVPTIQTPAVTLVFILPGPILCFFLHPQE